LNIEVRDTGDEFSIECQDDIALLKAIIVTRVNFSDHKELMALWVFFFDAFNPFC
jgi:hypothetical protein